MTLIAPGTCKHCLRTDDNLLRGADGEQCVWMDKTRTWCSNPDCVSAEGRRKAEAAEAARDARRKHGGRYKGGRWGYGAICEDLRARERGKK